MGLLPRRPRTRRNVLVAAWLLITAAVLGAVLWLNGGGSIPVASPTPSTSVEETQEPESTTPPPAPPSPTPSEVQSHAAFTLTGVATGRCETDTYSVTCRIDAAVYPDSDGRAQLQRGGSQYLLVKCSDTGCVASNVTKFELPCVVAGGSNVYCSSGPEEDRRGHYNRLISQVRGCETVNGVVECIPQAGTYTFGSQLYVGGWPAEAAVVNGKVGIYAVSAPAMDTIQPVSECYPIPTAGTIQCRGYGSGTNERADVTCGSDNGRLICGPFHPSQASQQTVSVYCPGGDTATVCSLSRQEPQYVNRVDCKEELAGEPGWRACTLARTD